MSSIRQLLDSRFHGNDVSPPNLTKETVRNSDNVPVTFLIFILIYLMEQISKITQQVVARTSTTLVTARSALGLIPSVIGKPAILRYCLLNARLAQIALILSILFMPTVVPDIIDSIIDRYSTGPTAMEKFSRLLKLNSEPETTHHETTRQIVWTGSSVLVLFLFLLKIPRATQESEIKSKENEQLANQANDNNSIQRLLLYQTAISLTISTERESALKTKIETLDNKQITPDQPMATQIVNSTLIVEPDDYATEELIIASRYHIKQLLGRGAMGSVFRAKDSVLDREVALKQLALHLLSETKFVERFRTEAKALAKLCHNNIVQIYDYIEDNNQVWIAMELVEGQELEQLISNEKVLPLKTCVKLGIQMSQAMAYAHDQGVVHRDFKPANVLITHDGDVKVMDFGLAKIARSSSQTQIGTIMGSPAFMSPEQASGKNAEAASDIYALGITLYLMSTGKLPFTGDAQSMLAQHLSQKPVAPKKINEQIPAKLNKLITSMLKKSPTDRPASMSEVTNQLAAIKI